MRYMVSLSVQIEAENTSDAYDRVVPAVAAGLRAITGNAGYVSANVVKQDEDESHTEPRDPQVGDPVLLRGRIISLDFGTAVVEVFRSDPVGLRVPVQAGALDLDEARDRVRAQAGVAE